MPHGGTTTFFDAQVIENNAIRKEPTHLTQYWTKRAVQFVEKEKDKPFFLYLAYNGPYGLGPAQLKDSERAPHWNDYADKDLPSFPRLPMHPWQFNNKEYLNNIQCIRRYAAEVTTIDDGVGEVLAKLRELHLDDNTVVIFAGDNGWSGGQNGLWGMGDHTRPLTAFDAQMRVPLIWWQPGRIVAGTVAQPNVSHIDFLPTLLDYLGYSGDLPASAKLTGRTYSPLLRGKAMPDWDDTVLYEFENMRCFRTPTEKFIERFKDEVDEHYDLARDPGEEHNLLTPTTDHTVLSAKLETLFKPNSDPRFDLWHGGKSKVETHVFPKPAK
jgi:arylsulfatase A-like enzyme